MNKSKLIIFFLHSTFLSYSMNIEYNMGSVIIKNISENISVAIPADLIPFTTISSFKEGVITSPLSSQFFQLLKDLLYANKTMSCLQKSNFKCTKNIVKLIKNNSNNLTNDFASWFELAYLIEILGCSSTVYDALAFHVANLMENSAEEAITVLENLPEARTLSAQGFFYKIAIYYDLLFEKTITTQPIEGYSIKDLLLCDLIKIKERSGRHRNNLQLDLSHMNINSLEGFNEIPHISQITNLDLSNNNITTLPSDFLLNFKDLLTVDLSNNNLSMLDENLFNSNQHLSSLYLDNNKLTSLPSNFLSSCKHLHRLNISNNQLTTLPENFLSHCPSLSIISLNDNKLNHLPENFLSQQRKIKIVSFRNNNIISLPPYFLQNNSTPETVVSLDSSIITNLNVLPQHIQDDIKKRGRKRSRKDFESDDSSDDHPAKRQHQ